MMPIGVVSGVIRRRMLVNYRVDPEVAQKLLPETFRLKRIRGYALAGICLIRLEQVRPKAFPAFVGMASENAAHRFAVEWDQDGALQEGVFIPRRDTDSVANHLAGGRIFAGEHKLSKFEIVDKNDHIHFDMHSPDGARIHLEAHATDALPSTSIFKSVEEASAFFESGSIGYSAREHSEQLDGIRLDIEDWKVQPLAVEEVYSSYFENRDLFPEGSVTFDCALLMRNIAHEWHALPE